MKKKTIIYIIVTLLIILGIILTIEFTVFSAPPVGFVEKRKVSNMVENYLTQKYGNHNFKVTDIEYDYDMQALFDYSNKEGYFVSYKGAGVESAVSVKGIYPNISKISDWFLKEYYFGDNGSIDMFQMMDNLEPKEKIESILFNKIKNEFDQNIQKVIVFNPVLDIPNDFGRIPTIEELKNNINLYALSEINYLTTINSNEEDDYKMKLNEYINQHFGEVSHCYVFIRKDSYYDVSCYTNRFNIGDILDNNKID